MHMTFRAVVAAGAMAAFAALPAAAQEFSSPSAGPLRVVAVASGLEHPWAFAFLPDGRLLVTERPGRLRIVERGGALSQPLAGVPTVQARGQGGLLDVVLDPAFARNRLIYLSYAEPGEGGASTAVARAHLGADRLDDVTVIYRQQPKVSGNQHFGSRLVFARDGTLFVTQGDRFNYTDSAQDLASGIGKVVRINSDGSIPRDNPFLGRGDARPEIWSLGHRNVQGAALHPETGQLWTIEHGARGGDEVNRVEAGKNYGWPVISYGVHYSGAKIGVGTAAPGLEQPLFYWDPSIAPSGGVFYTGDAFPAWKGSLITASLKFGFLSRLSIAGARVTGEERMLEGFGERIRDVRQAPDGALYFITDSFNGRILRLEPVEARRS